jgi:hypothetical protein
MINGDHISKIEAGEQVAGATGNPNDIENGGSIGVDADAVVEYRELNLIIQNQLLSKSGERKTTVRPTLFPSSVPCNRIDK